ncbi:anti-sigma B factor antagonist [Sedimentibacter acidaminivorans]|jgi:anti-sigma B factor antagonist|uniref:Anti-sigma factor antagonist n=1 Tax=Sedimentibacter acidaminivorans TaxID=913099 RepID=A0ABS4GF75_9FIRM|nr:STAS domain-containing protein [Sedimentibacter acidaminivorans]MBP1926304.1 anti-sigma B factor antagonist [Sedimentibacter acidaminivorans]
MSLDIKYSKTSDNNYLEIKPIGEVDISTSPEFKNKVIELIEKEKIDISINADELEYIDSTGLGVLMGILMKVKEHGLSIQIINLKPNIYKLFDITGLNKVFNIK